MSLTTEELQRLAECAREPIRTPGAIQPHGAMIGLDPVTFAVTLASENVAEMIGDDRPPLGRELADVIHPSFEWELRAFLAAPELKSNPLDLTVRGRSFDAIVHEIGGSVIVELEPVLPTPLRRSTSPLYDLTHRLAKAESLEELRTQTVRGLRALTGFDRVLLYHFHPDGHGEVVAEERADDMEPYLGLHFPSSDIPAQARALYITKLSRAIVGTSGATVALHAIDTGGEPQPALDLSCAELRAVSPHHLQFMRNMGQDSTLSFSLIRGGELIGMITCAHRSLLRLPFIMRRGLEVLANQVALQISALDQVARLRRQVSIRTARVHLMGQLAETDDIAESLVRGRVTVRDLISADGVALRVGGRTRTAGEVPPTGEVEALHAHLAQCPERVFVTDALKLQHPELAALAPSATGVLLVQIGGAGDYVAFFRSEVLRTVEWLGDQTSTNRLTPLSPRTSFSAWTGSVTDEALPWGELPAEAEDLGRDLEGALLRKVESELAHLALHDALTGLPNRRGLMIQLESALSSPSAHDQVAMLFIDLDGFKLVNDTYGHDVGDALLRIVATRISTATRNQDTVARLGGDEFVVFCDDSGAEEAGVIAGRILEAISRPTQIGAVTLTITASVGTAVADRTLSPAEFLRQADEAMYRAKESGKNAVSH